MPYWEDTLVFPVPCMLIYHPVSDNLEGEVNMKKRNRQHTFGITLLFMALILCFMLIALAFAGTTVYLLVRFNILTGTDQTAITPDRLIVAVILAALPFCVVVTVCLGKIPMKPVNRIINKMNQLAAGDYKVRLDFGKPLEKYPVMAELSDSFNRMAEELQSTEMLRSDFINNFSHEFKTPIVSIVGFTKLLRKGNLPEEQQAEYLRIIEMESLRLAQMATNVLNLTKVENQAILTDLTEYNLSEQIRSCILLLIEKWEEKGIEVAVDFQEHTIYANEELMKQVWINLLNNAVKFTPNRGMIEINITRKDGAVTVSIMNTGSEIAPEHQKNIFNKFYQADESHAAEGNGIGLAVVKRITELHKGTVSVSSENGSTTFTVTIPQKRMNASSSFVSI